MSKYKICVYGICKNEEQFVDRFMDCLDDADIVIIGDTGSTDNTADKFRNRGVLVYDIPIVPWRFDRARNEVLKLIPEDIDICVSLDVDEIILPGWRSALEKAWTKTATRARYLYTWSFNEDGSPGVQFSQHRIHARRNHRWIYPTHEVLEYIGDGNEEFVFAKGLTVEHYPDTTKNRGFNLELLELALKENPNDLRNTHYLGREYMFAKRFDEAIETLKKYLDHPNSQWDEERSASMRFIGICYNAKGNYREAKRWMMKAIAETPNIRDPYTGLAFISYANSDYNTLYFAVTSALEIKEKNILGYPNDPRGWNSFIYDLGAIACYNLGLFEKGLYYAKTALELSPNDERLKRNIGIIKEKLR